MKKLLKKFIPNWLLGTYHFDLAFFGALIYGFPSRPPIFSFGKHKRVNKLKVIGVTGTKGKSTVVILAGKVLAEGGKKVGWVSSLTINDGKNEVMNPYHMTMPGRFFIQKMLAQMVKNGCEYALVEVTSEGIKQYRHKFINFCGAVLTNLAPEHLEAHGGFDNYRAAKEKLFAAAAKTLNSFGVYNLDDENVQNFLEYEIKNKYGYALKNNFQFSISNFQSIFNIKNIQSGASGSTFEINEVGFKTNLLGEFNILNCAAAAGVGQACDVSLENAARALGKIQSIPGRLEIINEGQDFTAVVDLAHTPDSFEKVFKLFKDLKNSPHPSPLLEKEREKAVKIISVFGSAGGGRDKWKRPELGKIASANSDNVIICNEDPYDESPESICQEIAAGCENVKPEIILDRRQAIAKALSLAQVSDIVLILGKGTEQTYVEGAKKRDWDDRKVVREEIKKRGSSLEQNTQRVD